MGEVAADAEDILDHDDAREEGVSCCSHDASRLMREGTEIPVPRTELGSGVVVTVDLHCHDLEPADHGHTRGTWDSSEDADGNRRHLWRRHYHHFSGARSLKEEVEDDIHDND